MADRVPIVPISGALASFVNVDIPVATVAIGGTLTRVFLATLEAPGVGGITASVRTATGGGGSGVAATISQGAKSGYGDGTVTVADGATLYLRISAAAAGAGWLAGWFEFEESGAVVVIPVLTTLSLVKQHAGISSGDHDTLLTFLIEAVSVAMQTKMRRNIVSQTITDERHNSIGAEFVSLQHWPLTTDPVTVRENLIVLGSTDFEIDRAAGILTRTVGGYAIAWATGKRVIGVDYTAGYATVPNDLVLAATKQVRHEFAQTNPSGADRLGKKDVTTPAGGVQAFEPDGWLPSVLQAMATYTRK